MRNKQKELFCVACDTLVIDQKEFDPKIHTAVNKDQLQNTPAAPTNNNSASNSVNDNKAKQAQQTQAQQTIGGSTSVEKRDDAIQKRPEAVSDNNKSDLDLVLVIIMEISLEFNIGKLPRRHAKNLN